MAIQTFTMVADGMAWEIKFDSIKHVKRKLSLSKLRLR